MQRLLLYFGKMHTVLLFSFLGFSLLSLMILNTFGEMHAVLLFLMAFAGNFDDPTHFVCRGSPCIFGEMHAVVLPSWQSL